MKDEPTTNKRFIQARKRKWEVLKNESTVIHLVQTPKYEQKNFQYIPNRHNSFESENSQRKPYWYTKTIGVFQRNIPKNAQVTSILKPWMG